MADDRFQPVDVLARGASVGDEDLLVAAVLHDVVEGHRPHGRGGR
ncbi:hypothetical protein ACWGHM_14840 [Streptomyces sp. NPDC054904]